MRRASRLQSNFTVKVTCFATSRFLKIVAYFETSNNYHTELSESITTFRPSISITDNDHLHCGLIILPNDFVINSLITMPFTPYALHTSVTFSQYLPWWIVVFHLLSFTLFIFVYKDKLECWFRPTK